MNPKRLAVGVLIDILRENQAVFTSLSCSNNRIGWLFSENGIFGNEDFLNLFLRRGIIHHVQHHFFQDRPKSSGAGFLVKGFPCDRAERAFREFELHLLKGEQFFILFGERVSRLGQDSNQSAFIQFIQGGNDRQPTDELRNQAVLEKIFRLNLRQQFAKSYARFFRELQLQIPSLSD